ncbi:MAG: DNA-binding protein [Deltaproteobacteria bacterium]|nr:DNA-binding protein [Deltaproteobacteria bacterium]
MAYAFSKFGAEGWSCPKCQQPLQPVEVNVKYMGSSFFVELPGCPTCGTILVDEELAVGRMLEVEKLLEDK